MDAHNAHIASRQVIFICRVSNERLTHMKKRFASGTFRASALFLAPGRANPLNNGFLIGRKSKMHSVLCAARGKRLSFQQRRAKKQATKL
jgi:hypothetical protein